MKLHKGSLSKSLCVTLLALLAVGCAHIPGGITDSTTPLEGRKYSILGHETRTDSLVYLLGFIPIRTPNTTRDAITAAINARRGDAMINVTVEYSSQYWILFSRHITIVDGDVIRFDR